MDQKPVIDFTHEAQEPLLKTNPHWITSLSLLSEEHNSGSHRVETLRCHDNGEGVLTEDDHTALSNDGLSDFSSSDISLSEVCVTSNTNDFEEEMNYEVQQAYRIFSEFLAEKHKLITSPFLHPVGNQGTSYGTGGVRSRSQANVRQSMCLRRMEEKFMDKEYATITEFVADFRLMLENCYRYHGVDHWLSKQAQKMEIMLEQKLTLLSRKLREKTALAVTSKGRFSVGEEHVSTSSTRRRQTPRCLKTLSAGGPESIMVQTLRLEEQQKAKEEKRQRELEKKEAEEMSAKEMDEWEKNLLSQASPHSVETLWELPAVGHFLCLAQTALNLPEIVFYELERCLLMPRCSILLSKIMSSLLCPPQRRSTLHRRPVMPYRRWESELRQRVNHWYQAVGASHDQAAQAEQLGLCYQFFSVLGEISPLEGKAFHMLPFYQRVWLLKGLCDHVYETQRDVQDAVLAQPIHDCRESILGYDSKENAYIHFPHFCGADLRIYCQSPCTSPTFPLTSVLVKKVQILAKLKEESVSEVHKVSGTSQEDNSLKAEMYMESKIEKDEFEEDSSRLQSCKTRKDSPVESKINGDTKSAHISSPFRKRILITKTEEQTSDYGFKSKRLKEENETNCSLFKNETVIPEHCLSIGEHCYTGRSPAGSQKTGITTTSIKQEDQKPSCCQHKLSHVKLEQNQCGCGFLGLSTQSKLADTREERVNDTVLTMIKELKKKKGKTVLSGVKPKPSRLRRRSPEPESAKPSVTLKRKDLAKTHTQDKALNHLKNKQEHSQPSFKLVCSNLDDLRELINKTEDELDDLESTKKRLNRWHNRREAVKELHSTLIRLLNELTPWEPKLIKAYQRNRLRLKKEFEVFKNHPEYNNFVREECVLSPCDDGDLNLLLEQFRQSGHDDPEHVLPRGLGGTVKESSTELATGSPEACLSYRHQNRPTASTSENVDRSDTPKATCESDLRQSAAEPRLSNSSFSPSLTVPSSTPDSLHTAKLKNYSPIPTLLAKSVGNKVTLMKQPAYPSDVNILNPEFKINCCSSEKHQQNSDNAGVTFPVLLSKTADSTVNSSSTNQRSEEPQQVVILNKNEEAKSSKLDMFLSSNVSNRLLIQQVPPTKNTDKTSSLCDILAFPKSQHSNVIVAKSQCKPDYSGFSTSTNSKQELKTVCIRESQSILVTTRGGNTGIVKVQKSSENPACLSKSPIITISPQFQAYLVPKAPVSDAASLKPNAVVTESCPASLKHVPSLSSFAASPKLAADKPYSAFVNEDNRSVCCTKASVSLTNSTTKAPLLMQDSSPSLKQAAVTGSLQGINPSPTQKMLCQTWTSVSSVAPTRNKAVFVSPGGSTASITVPYMIASVQNSAAPRPSSTCRGAEQTRPITAQPVFLNSSVISRGISTPNSLKHLVTKIPQPGSVLYPSTNASKPIPTPSTQNKSVNTQIITDIGALSTSLSLTKPQVSSEISKGLLTKTPSAPAVQQQIVISTSVPLPGGARIVLNNAHFMVPPQGLGPGSHVFFISGGTPQHAPATSTKELQNLDQCVPASPSFVAATTSFVTADASSHKAKAASIERTSTFPILRSVLPHASSALITTTSSALHKPSTPFKSDPEPTKTTFSSQHSKSVAAAFMHMGQGSLVVQKEEAPSSKNVPEAQCPVIMSAPAAEKHLLQTSFLKMHSPLASKLLVSPDGAVLRTVQCQIKSTKEQLDV